MSKTQLKMVILYADVSGSTRLYETFGDAKASSDVHILLDKLTVVAEEFGGKKVKTIGDEVMCMFYKPEKAAQASIKMNQVLQEANEEGCFQCGDLHVKMGWHYGVGSFRGDDVLGEAPTLAQQVICMAKRDEILTTQKSIDELPAMIKCTAVFIDRVEAEDGSGDMDVYSLPWDDNDSDATIVTSEPQEMSPGEAHSALKLRYRDKEFEMNANVTHCHVGRGEDNDLVVFGEFTSRHHAEIFYRHGRFHLIDMSTNGTGVIHPGDNIVRLHREEKILHDSGTLCFGGEPKTDADAAVEYECIKGA